jgi:hypothetical protein
LKAAAAGGGRNGRRRWRSARGGGSGGVRVMIWGLGVPWPAELEGRSEWRQARRRWQVMGGEVGRDGAAGQAVEEPRRAVTVSDAKAGGGRSGAAASRHRTRAAVAGQIGRHRRKKKERGKGSSRKEGPPFAANGSRRAILRESPPII